ncbi:siderophore-interacting protein [Achromobacter xylosoxidans]
MTAMTDPRPEPGRVSRLLTRLFMTRARVARAETPAPGFRLITLESPAFREASWRPGQKVQIAMGSAFVARTYSPIEWDAVAGRTRLLVCCHGGGPGSAWARQVTPGDECDVFGPRASLDPGRVQGRCVLLGDETSLGLAYAISRHFAADAPHCLLEVAALGEARAVSRRLGLEAVELFERCGDDGQLDAIARRLPVLAGADRGYILTGRAPSIQRLRRTLAAQGVPGARIMAKAYWAPGKRGLD